MLTSDWQKSEDSNPSGNCVEARLVALDAAVEVRDSKNPHRDTLIFTRDEWTAFLGGARRRQFDLPD